MPKTTLQNDSEVMRWRGAHQTLAGWECTPEQDAIHQDTYARFTAFWATEDRYNVYGADRRVLARLKKQQKASLRAALADEIAQLDARIRAWHTQWPAAPESLLNLLERNIADAERLDLEIRFTYYGCREVVNELLPGGEL